MKTTREEAEASLIRFIIENNRYPSKRDCRYTEWLYSTQTYQRILGPRDKLTLLEDYGKDINKEKLFKPCEQCGKDISDKPSTNRFCGSSCSATYNNLRKPRRPRKVEEEKPFKFTLRKTKVLKVRLSANCIHCQQELVDTQSLYCSLQCMADFRFKTSLELWLSTGKAVGGNKAIRKYITHLDGYKCSCCGLSDWNDKPITLEVEHISGDSTDDSRENVCLICPNCHSQTSTYKGKNRGKGRHWRTQRYYDDKSY